MERTYLSGTLHTADEAAWNQVLRLSGVPRIYWEPKIDHICFTTFTQSNPKRTDAPPSRWAKARQREFFESILACLRGAAQDHDSGESLSLEALRGLSFSISSEPTDHLAKCAAALLIHTAHHHNIGVRTRWVDVNRRGRWGQIVGPDYNVHPDMTVLTGLHPAPTSELWESVRRWHEWATTNGCCVLVGTGANPVELVRCRFNLHTRASFYIEGAARQLRTAG